MKHLPNLLVLASAFLLFSCGKPLPQVTDVQVEGPRLTRLSFASPALEKGTRPGMTGGRLVVLVPPSYGLSADKRYPVVYTFHGYGDRLDQMIRDVAPLAEASKETPEFIMVGIEGGNTFYSDSAIHGDVARMVVDEVVALVDSRYRTIPRPEARMAAGFSMGGYAAWNLGLTFPEVFGSVWSVCPGAFDPNGLKDALATWDRTIYADYAATFAPQVFDPKAYSASPPRFDGTPDDTKTVADLEKGFGNIPRKLQAYGTQGARLKAVRLDFGTYDGYDWIPRGTQFLAEQIRGAGIPVSVLAHPTGHQISLGMVDQGFLPLVRSVFAEF